ncbi:hypothetical protein [Altererythrobacter sp. GH1-8]|uniref:hypothetical protein n=1 Tax=Altererythrobacter sp. GH1-8 TaxID=3349333 RepID=UPI00374D49F3
MMPSLNDLMSPDMQKIALFLVPTFAAVFALVMNLSRGFSTIGTVVMVLCGLVAVYFAPQFFTLF